MGEGSGRKLVACLSHFESLGKFTHLSTLLAGNSEHVRFEADLVLGLCCCYIEAQDEEGGEEGVFL